MRKPCGSPRAGVRRLMNLVDGLGLLAMVVGLGILVLAYPNANWSTRARFYGNLGSVVATYGLIAVVVGIFFM